ncbi:MAG: hypothetical protein RLZZ04_915 [Cyanobacteriota bacterium]|jgi:hypothetical protein
MKAKYSAPKLTNYGNVETITQVIGDAPASDSLIVNGKVIPGTTGDSDFSG